jgi:hypothetical protein
LPARRRQVARSSLFERLPEHGDQVGLHRQVALAGADARAVDEDLAQIGLPDGLFQEAGQRSSGLVSTSTSPAK